MGLEITLLKTHSNINLVELYSIRSIIEDEFDWWLGSDKTKKKENYDSLYQYATQKITREEVLKHIPKDDQHKDIYEFLSNIKPSRFDKYLKFIMDSIGEYNENNSHLFFYWEKLPGNDVFFSCSRSLHSILMDATLPKGDGATECLSDTLFELNPVKIISLANRFLKMKWKFNFIQFFLWFIPSVGERMLNDMLEHEFPSLPYCDIYDLKYLMNSLVNARNAIERNHRLWLVSSY